MLKFIIKFYRHSASIFCLPNYKLLIAEQLLMSPSSGSTLLVEHGGHQKVFPRFRRRRTGNDDHHRSRNATLITLTLFLTAICLIQHSLGLSLKASFNLDSGTPIVYNFIHSIFHFLQRFYLCSNSLTRLLIFWQSFIHQSDE